MMEVIKHYFELRIGFVHKVKFFDTFEFARRIGDRFATRLGNVQLYAYNDKLYRMELIGTFHGGMRFTDTFGDRCSISKDFLRLERHKS